MSTLTLSDITAAPAGYSFVVVDNHPQNDKRYFWIHVDLPRHGSVVELYPVYSSFFAPALFKRNDDGDIVFDQSAFDERAANQGLNSLRPIPDAEFPEGGMTRYHTHFNETSRKWELPDIESEVHAHHERTHDADVMSAVAVLCGVELHLMHKAASLVGLNAANTEKANGKYADFDACLDDIVAANAEGALERAWLDSLGVIRHTGRDNPEDEFVTAAHDFAAAYLAMINGKTPAQLGAPRYRYAMCLFAALRADAGKAGSARFLPRGVKLVERKSSPADAAEVTLDALFAKLKSAVSPAEGPAKGG